MNAARLAGLVSATAFAGVLGAALAHAADPCIGDAKTQAAECKATCTENFQLAKDNCLNRDHACVEVCRAKREECRLATGLDAALDACNQTLYEAKETCRNDHPEGSAERDQCIDQAQVVAFQCRDAAREAARPALMACRVDFRRCARTCPPPSTPSGVTDPVQCKIDATAAGQACRSACREEFQFQKDACLGRDHVCVESCRAARDTCRQPIQDQLAADITACNRTRDADIQTCVDTTGEGTLERDQCIDATQLAAFQCRDAKREALRPRFEGCRQAFRDCVMPCALEP